MKTKSIFMATGDIYDGAVFEGDKEEFIKCVEEGELIKITTQRTEILINSEYIVSVVF